MSRCSAKARHMLSRKAMPGPSASPIAVSQESAKGHMPGLGSARPPMNYLHSMSPCALALLVMTATAMAGSSNAYCGKGDVWLGGASDGPAQLPQHCIYTGLDGTPSPGAVTLVPAGGNFQAALNAANCGDTIELQAGASFSGVFSLPAKACDAAHWITVRTSAPDTSLPAEANRVTPCYAGVTSLPGRPAYACSAPSNVLGQVVTSSGRGPFVLSNGANHYRLIGLEI